MLILPIIIAVAAHMWILRIPTHEGEGGAQAADPANKTGKGDNAAAWAIARELKGDSLARVLNSLGLAADADEARVKVWAQLLPQEFSGHSVSRTL